MGNAETKIFNTVRLLFFLALALAFIGAIYLLGLLGD